MIINGTQFLHITDRPLLIYRSLFLISENAGLFAGSSVQQSFINFTMSLWSLDVLSVGGIGR